MKKILAWLLVLTMLIASNVASAEPDKVVEVLKIGTTKPADAFNIMVENGSYGKMNYNGFCAAPFLVPDAEGHVQPFIMTGWEISDDQNSMIATFATDQGIMWHDGQPLTMDDILFTFDFMINVKKSTYVKNLLSVEKIDDTTAKFTFENNAAFGVLNNMAMSVYVYPKHIWEGVEDYQNYAEADAAIGCGPYKLTQIDAEAQVVSYEAVGERYLGRELTVKKVLVRSYDSHDALVMALKTGEVDAMFDYSNALDASMKPAVTGVENLDPGMSVNPGNFQLVFGFNVEPTNDVEFRRAVAAALDYTLLATAIGGEDGEVANCGIISPVNKGFDATLPTNRQDVEAAMAILDAAGYVDVDGDGLREDPKGEAMSVLVTPQYNATRSALYLRISEILIQNLQDVGINAVLDEESVRNSDHFSEFNKSGMIELCIGYTSPGVAQFRSAYAYMTAGSLQGTCDIPELVEAYNDMVGCASYEEYNENMAKLQKVNSEQVVGIALCWDKAYFPYRTDKYEGWTNFPGFGVINNQTWYTLHTK